MFLTPLSLGCWDLSVMFIYFNPTNNFPNILIIIFWVFNNTSTKLQLGLDAKQGISDLLFLKDSKGIFKIVKILTFFTL